MSSTKKWSKALAAFAVAALTTMALAMPAFAATVSIENQQSGQTYDVYKIFDATTRDTNNNSTIDTGEPVAYTIDSDGADSASVWSLLTSGLTATSAGAFSNTTYGLTFTPTTTDPTLYNVTSTMNDAQAASLAAMLKENVSSISSAKVSSINGGTTSADVSTGYYFVTTTTGTLCALATEDSTQVVRDKNTLPTIDKDIVGVKDSSNTDTGAIQSGGEAAHAQVGDTVSYRVTINAHAGAENYILNDTLSDGLTLVNTISDGKNTGIKVNDGSDLSEGDQYTVTIDDKTIKVSFATAYLSGITDDKTITVSYDATVNSNAAVGADGNKNTATLQYGHTATSEETPGSTTPADEPKVYVANFTITKTDGDNAALTGAKFKLYKVVDNVKMYYVNTENVISWSSDVNAATEVEADSTDSHNVAVFTGLANGIYWITESTTPAGYNTAADSSFTIVGEDFSDTNLKQSTTVVNQAGSLLPSTGGMGTTILYVVGGIMIVAAGLVLVVKRRLA